MNLVRIGRLMSLAAASAVLLVTSAACSYAPTGPTGATTLNRTDLRAGTGPEAVNGSQVTVHYTGWFYNADAPNGRGAVFDSSLAREPFTFVLGVGQVIPGWDLGVVGMREGGIRRLVIPPPLAYGSIRNASIPPNASLLFDIELLRVE